VNQKLLLAVPILAWITFFIQHQFGWPWFNIVLIPFLIMCVLHGVKHAEVIAQRVGQPFDTLVLALSITAIESSLILSIMIASGPESSSLARDTVFAAIMIILNGMIGISLIAGSRKYREQSFITDGINALLITLVAMAVLTFVFPNFALSMSGPHYNSKQLLFVAFVTLALYFVFLYVQNFRHKEYFVQSMDEGQLEEKPAKKQVMISTILLFVCLGAVVAIAEALANPLNNILDTYGAPRAITGIIIAAIILLPEALSAYKAANANQLQKSLNFSLGSAVASIGLTIPIVSLYALFSGMPLALGIDPKSTTLLLLSIFMVIMALRTGRTTILHGMVLFLIFLVYLFFTVVP
jgi:Ca2+:H+ antiporter